MDKPGVPGVAAPDDRQPHDAGKITEVERPIIVRRAIAARVCDRMIICAKPAGGPANSSGSANPMQEQTISPSPAWSYAMRGSPGTMRSVRVMLKPYGPLQNRIASYILPAASLQAGVLPARYD